jgi:hypothetical protein
MSGLAKRLQTTRFEVAVESIFVQVYANNWLIETLDVFIRLPQTFKVFFGGGHDNGYHGTLAATHTIGLKEKLVLLQSYAQLAREISMLNLPTLEIPSLFMAEKLDQRPLLKKFASISTSYTIYSTPQVTPTPKKKGPKDVPKVPKSPKAAKKKAKFLSPQPPAQEALPRTSEEILVGDQSTGGFLVIRST